MPNQRLDRNNLLLVFLFVGTTTLFLFGLFLPLSCQQKIGISASDSNYLRQIGIALYNYHEHYGSLPPPYVTDAAGKPLYSWRVLILPYLDRNDIYQAFHLDEPWNSPHNQRLSNLKIKVLQQNTETHSAPSITNIVVVRGPGTLFPRQGKVRHKDVTDGIGNTIMLVSLANSDIHWAEPRDLDIETMSFQINDPNKPSISRTGYDGANVGFADCHIQWVSDDTPPEVIRAALTINGGEKVELSE